MTTDSNVLATTTLRAELDQALAREAVLQGVVDNLCKLQEREAEKEEGQQGPWPDWGEAWEQAFAVRYGASQVAQELLKKIDECTESL